MSVTDELLANAEGYASGFDKGDLPMPPARKVAVVACMDARLDPQKVLGLAEGDGHVIRNAGGVVTDDAIRSLAISQRQLGTEEVVLIQHTGCGMLTFTDDEFKRAVLDDTGGWQITGPPEGSGANANNWEITDAGGFPVGASITTPKSILMGYGFETISTAEQRNAVMGRIASYLLR